MVSQHNAHVKSIATVTPKEELILKALEEIPFSRSTTIESLFDGFVVLDYFASLPHFPDSKCVREFVLEYLLITLITERYFHQRRIFGLETPKTTETRVQAANTLRLDAKQGGKQLLVWSMLYHRFVRIDLEFSPQEISDILSCSPRTLRRYREQGIKAISRYLFWIEWHLRTTRKKEAVDDHALPTEENEPESNFLPEEAWWVFAIARRVLVG